MSDELRLRLDEAVELQTQGANARALGRTYLDNPFYRSDAMPAATGEATELWKEKVDAWHVGWVLEDASRV